jgi:hypothetical protein
VQREHSYSMRAGGRTDGRTDGLADVKKLTVAFHNVAMVPERLTTSRSVHWSCILYVMYVK